MIVVSDESPEEALAALCAEVAVDEMADAQGIERKQKGPVEAQIDRVVAFATGDDDDQILMCSDKIPDLVIFVIRLVGGDLVDSIKENRDALVAEKLVERRRENPILPGGLPGNEVSEGLLGGSPELSPYQQWQWRFRITCRIFTQPFGQSPERQGLAAAGTS